MNFADLPDDSESSDEDYVPEGINVELPSEEDSDGDEEAPLEADASKPVDTKRQKTGSKSKKKHKTQESGIKETPEENKEENKQEADALWADFMKDTGFKTRAERSQTSTTTDGTDKTETKKPTETKSESKVKQQNKVKVTEIYEFAGEQVKVEKEVIVDSPQAASGSLKRTPSGGDRLGSILNQLGKKRKINTLEKSKLDWDKFKKDEKIEDELQAYSKSKDGYLEKQDFLERADLRRFEIEKEIRNTLRSNRMNNVDM